MRRLWGRLGVLVAVVAPLCGLQAQTGGITGNWAVENANGDGALRRSYFTLTQQGDTIRGTIRTTQFYFRIKEGAGAPDRFTIVGSMMDGANERKVTYEGRLAGDSLHLATRRRATDTTLVRSVAHRVPAGEGAIPARAALPGRHLVTYNGLAKTPPMGWNSWNKFAGRVDDASVRGMADAMAGNGMREAGYEYVNIDNTWEGERDAQGNITTNRKFPDMKALADYVHSKGLKLGIYSSPGPNTCAGYEGSYGHEAQDARTFAAWGIDYLKYDWCGARNLYTDEEMPAVYQIMGDGDWQWRDDGRRIPHASEPVGDARRAAAGRQRPPRDVAVDPRHPHEQAGDRDRPGPARQAGFALVGVARWRSGDLDSSAR